MLEIVGAGIDPNGCGTIYISVGAVSLHIGSHIGTVLIIGGPGDGKISFFGNRNGGMGLCSGSGGIHQKLASLGNSGAIESLTIYPFIVYSDTAKSEETDDTTTVATVGDLTAFLGKCYLLSEELMPVLVNIKGVVDGVSAFVWLE